MFQASDMNKTTVQVLPDELVLNVQSFGSILGYQKKEENLQRTRSSEYQSR
jgi:hypothetical protein